MVESLLENARNWIDWCLLKVKSYDGITGTAAFVGLYVVYCLALIFICKFWYRKSRKARRPRKPYQEPAAGKRSSQRLRLQKHELVFVERVSEEEFERQKKDYTKEQIAKLEASKEFAKMKRLKGKAVENWNWQANESKYGPESDISSEYDIISNYQFSESSDEDESFPLYRKTTGGTIRKTTTATMRKGVEFSDVVAGGKTRR